MKQIGRELGVRYVVEGSVRKSGNRVRITAQLIEAETGAHIWADRYEGDLRDIFALQDEITEQIVSAIEPTVRTVEIKRALAKPTDNLTAYDSYLRALPYYYSQTREAVTRAESLLRKAIDLDPGYAEALGTLADCIAIRTSTGWHESRRRAIDEACEAARRALAAGPDNSTCLASCRVCLRASSPAASRRRASLPSGRSTCTPTRPSCATGPARSTASAARATRRSPSSRQRSA